MCWDRNTAAPSSKTFTITGLAENNTTVTATSTVSFRPPAGAAAALSIAPQSVELTAADNKHDANTLIDIGFGHAATEWKASVTPANAATAWLKLGRVSGASDGQLPVRAATSDLSNGVYRASIAIEAPGAVPDHFTIPVVLVVGASEGKIAGIANAASFQQAFAPGMLLSIFGDGLATTGAQARTIPLPLTLAGVSATVNGIAAPIEGIFPGAGQINIQVPYEAGAGPAVVALNNRGSISYYRFTMAVSAPGLFGLWDASGRPAGSAKAGQTLVAYITGEGDITGDGFVTPFIPTGDTPPVSTSLTRLPKARQPLAVTVDGSPAAIVFNGIPSGLVGVTQINFTLPASLAPGPHAVAVTVGDATSQTVMLNVTP
jgi:uncharacterized protein (TIGR03437 family)